MVVDAEQGEQPVHDPATDTAPAPALKPGSGHPSGKGLNVVRAENDDVQDDIEHHQDVDRPALRGHVTSKSVPDWPELLPLLLTVVQITGPPL